MNSTELYLAAGEAICEWGKTHNEGCSLCLNGEQVLCHEMDPQIKKYLPELCITKYEVNRGMTSVRWNEIGTALHKLFCKELKCQNVPKP